MSEYAKTATEKFVLDRVGPAVIGKLPMKALPKYLHYLPFDDTYPEDAAWLYAQLGPSDLGRCSAVRRGGKLFRNYDWTFDDAAEFVVKMSGNATRFASVGVASVGSRLTENDVMSAVNSRYYKCLPGMTLDGINERGVVCEINVDGGPKDGWHGDAEEDGIHILAAVRWVLDHGETAAQAAAYIADHIIQPQGEMNFHFMVADATSTYIVENGSAHDVTDGTKVLTNYALYDEAQAGGGKERYQLLAEEADIKSVWFTYAYQSGNDWDSDFESHEQHLDAIDQWFEQGETKEAHRGKTTTGGKAWWQSVHTTEYDFAAKTMKVAVQEVDDWYTFAVDAVPPSVTVDDTVTQTSANPVKSSGIWSFVKGLLNALELPWSKVTGKPSTFPPSAHSHETDSWFVTAINAVKALIPSLPSWLTPTREEPPTQASVAQNTADINYNTGNISILQTVTNELRNGVSGLEQTVGNVIIDLDGKADRAALAPEYSSSSAYTVGAFVFHNGNIYRCTTAIAAPGEAWTPAHWSAEQKLDDFFKESNSLLTGTIDARLPYPLVAYNAANGLLDRTINMVGAGVSSLTVPNDTKDTLIRLTAASAVTSITFALQGAKHYGDAFPTAAGDYLVTVTRIEGIAAGETAGYYVRTIEMTEAA